MIRRLLRSLRILAHDGRIPRPLRGLFLFYRESLRDAWGRAATP